MPFSNQCPDGSAVTGAGPELGGTTPLSSAEEWNRTAEYPPDRCIHALFEAQAARTPDAVAVVFEEQSLRYRELNERANRLARRLVRLGVGPEVRVGIGLERNLEMVISLLAVLKAGGAYVPLDPGYPPERLEMMLADCGAGVLLTGDATGDLLPAPVGTPVLNVDRSGAEIAAERADDLEGRATPRNLAYVIYTSGSTGTPKGVGVEHRALVNHMRWFVRDFGLSADDRVLLKTPISFDASVWELHAPLLVGGRLVVARQGGEREPRYLVRTIQSQEITTLQLVPTLFRVLLETPELGACTSLRRVFCGGEALPGELCRRHAELLPGARLVNLYGPTECCIDTSVHRCGEDDGRCPVVPIGRPVPNTSSHVLDAALLPVPAGVPGELCIGGVQVARGYLNRPALTAERFVPDSFAPEPGARLYRTGDRARLREDGVLEYLGRLDEQVKIRGFRVELGEIEAVLRQHAGVAECAVVAREDGAGERRLVGYVVGTADPETLRASLRRRLPEHMVPGAFVVLDRLPLAPNGKLDRMALPAPEPAPAEGRYAPPRTPVEEALAGIWREVLGVERVGVDQPFLELGGHSLAGIRILARIADAFGVEIAPHVLLRSGSIAEIAAVLEAAGDAPPRAASVPALERVSRDGPLPLSFAQEGAWFFEQFSPGQLAYHAQSTIRITGPLDVAALERALSEIVRRHEIFRTTFQVENEVPVQRIHPPWRVQLPVRDLAGLAGPQREAAVRELVGAEFGKTFDTARLPLVRWSLLRFSADEHVFVNVEHHYLHDGWSFGLLLRELRELYLAYVRGEESPLPEPAVQFADFAVWQRRWMRSEAAEAGLRFWEETLAGVSPLVLPTDFPRPAVLRFRGAGARVRLSPALAAEARAFSREHGVTFFVTLLAAFQALLARYSGQRDFCVASALGNRGQVALEHVIGMVVNTVALRADLAGDPTAVELLRRVRDTTLRAYEHQDVPFLEVVRRIQPERSTDALPVCQVGFSFHNAPMPDLSFAGLHLELEEAQNNGSSKFDLQVVAIPRAEQGIAGAEEEVLLVWEYNTDLFLPETAGRMIRHYLAVLEGLVRTPHRRVSELAMLGEEERRLVVEEWNRTEAAFPADRCIHQLFEAQAERTPDALAVVHERESLTYRELNARANRLAHHLRRRGVGPEARVGVCLERGLELVVSLLAVLKAGGAYVPLDPGYPAERLRLTLADAGARVLLTEEKLLGLLPPQEAAEVVVLERARPEIAAEPADDPRGGATPRNLAYLIYTSGSTGVPKGVAIEHQSAVAMLAWSWSVFSAEEIAGMLASTSVCFDLSVFELFAPLGRGGRVIVVENALALPGSAAADQVRLINTVPSAIAALLTAGGIPSGVKTVCLAGEPLKAELADALYARGVERVYDLYGPSEDTTYSTYALRREGGPATIGRPISNSRCYVVDAALQPVPVGVPGELYMGGRGVTRGYLGRPGLTADRYVPDPFAAEPGARMYRTGDRVRWKDDGTLEYLGRGDQQVKIRGFRIEPGEIEAALRRHPGVRDCAVVAREDAPGEKRLVAYVAAEPDAGWEPALRAHLRGKLPEYMVPAAFVVLDRLPLTPNGKLDRKALPAPEPGPAEAEWVAPATEAEHSIARIWQELLGRERVGLHDDFFELGGDSLLATRVVIRTRDLLRREVPLVTLFDHRTLAAFSAAATTSLPLSSAPGDDDPFGGFDVPAGVGAGWDDASLPQA